MAPPPAPGLERAPVPSFSVLISAYQAAPFVGAAVESALRQTCPPLEVIVCDDGSTDDTEAALAPYRDEITLIRQEHAGTASAANAALAAAGGDFVVQLGADDVFEPERLEALGELAAERPDLEILATDVALEVDGRVIDRFNRRVPFPTANQRIAILHRCFCAAPAMRRIRMLALGGFDERLATGEDWDILMRLLFLGCSAGLVDEPLYAYRLRQDSLTGSRIETLRDRVTLLERFADHPGLTTQEWAELRRSLSTHRSRLTFAEAEAALRRSAPDARRRALRVAMTRSHRLGVRVSALGAAAAPRFAGRVLERRAEVPGRSTLARSAWHAAGPVAVEASPVPVPAFPGLRPVFATDGRPRRVLAPEQSESVVAGEAQSFSVIIPVYQAAAFVGDAIESALEQEPQPLEVIVCDDGSTDEIDAAVAPYLDAIVFVRQEHRGSSAAKNRAAGLARGEFVSVLDADDRYLPGYLAAIGELAGTRPDLDIITTDAYLELDGRVFARYYRGKSRFVVDDQRRGIIHQHFVYAPAAFRRERLLRLGGYDESLLAAGDTDFLIRMILDGARVGLVDEPLCAYRLRSGSLSSHLARSLRLAVDILERTRANATLSAEERRYLEAELTIKRQEAELAEAEEALRGGAGGARPRALRIAFGHGYAFPARAKAVAAAIAPSAAGRFLALRERRTGSSRLATRTHGR